MLLDDLDVVDRQVSSSGVDAEDLVADIAQVADRDGEALRIGSSGAEQNRLLGSTAGAADAPQLQDSNRPGHDDAAAVRGRDRGAERAPRARARGRDRTRTTRRTPAGCQRLACRRSLIQL